MADKTLIRIDRPFALSLAGPLLAMVGYLYSDAVVDSGGVLTVTSDSQALDYDRLDLLMEFLQGEDA